MDAYIDSLEFCESPKTEQEWREIITAEKQDILQQNPDSQVVDTEEVIKRLDNDGYIRR